MQTLQRLKRALPTESAASQNSPEIAKFPDLVNKGEVPQKAPRLLASLHQLDVLADVIDLEVPVPDQDLAPTEFGPVYHEVEEVVQVKAENPEARLRRTIADLRQQIKQLSPVTDEEQIDRIVRSLSKLTLDQAFNQAQTFYTTTMLNDLERGFAVALSKALYQLFASQGRVYRPWADFVSLHTVTQ